MDDEHVSERLGSRSPRCRQCGEMRIHTLTGWHPNILCYECAAVAAGRQPIELHHFAGQHNSPDVVAIPGNDHRIVSHAQNTEWPSETLRNPGGSPALKAAALIRGWLDVLRRIIDRLDWIAPFLEWVDGQLSHFAGPRWWVRLDGWSSE
jgi:hypothetical protein